MIYLDNAATTNFKPTQVVNATVDALTKYSCNPNRNGSKLCIEVQQKIVEVRQKVARLVNGKEQGVIFTSGCTASLNLALLGTAKKGHVVTTVAEHNSVLRPLDALAKHGVQIDYLPTDTDGQIAPKQLEQALKKDTYLVCVNHVGNVNGQKRTLTQIGQICKARNITFVVDCAQSVGYTNIDMLQDNIDLVAFGAHKGLHGMQGVGVLCCGDTTQIRPIAFGGTGTDSHLTSQPTNIPDGFEVGTLPTPSILALGAAIDWHNDNKQQIAANVQAAQQLIQDGLAQIQNVKLYSFYNESGIVCFNIGKLDSNAVADVLSEKFDIAVRGGLHCAPLMHKSMGTFDQGAVRASVSCVTTRQECYKLLNAVEYIAKHTKNVS